MGMHVLLVGNPIDGFRVIGPFKTADHAIEAGEGPSSVGDDWWIAPLEAPEEN